MTLFLIRHGSAGTRNPVDPHDHLRHLDKNGTEQAAMIAQYFSATPLPFRFLSSPVTRCVETVEPAATQGGTLVEIHEALGEGQDPSETLQLLFDLATNNISAVLCTHGDILPDVVRRLCIAGMATPHGRGTRKGSLMRLTFDGERFVLGEYFDSAEMALSTRQAEERSHSA